MDSWDLADSGGLGACGGARVPRSAAAVVRGDLGGSRRARATWDSTSGCNLLSWRRRQRAGA